jgi:hypothetical protein
MRIGIRDIAGFLDDIIEKGTKIENGEEEDEGPKEKENPTPELGEGGEDEKEIKKGLSFDLMTPHTMGYGSRFYNPYRMMPDGSFMPHDAAHWTSMGKNKENYMHHDDFFKEYGLVKSFRQLKSSVPNMLKIEKGGAEQKVNRSAFIYMEPRGKNINKFAQCATCNMWTGAKHNTCTVMGPHVEVKGSMSCALYANGEPMPEAAGHEMISTTPEEAGLIDTKVRCENCKYVDAKNFKCQLFAQLNRRVPQIFNLNESVHPKACCNAFMPHPKSDK